MKTILRVLTLVLMFVAFQCSLSSAQVVIKPKTAEYFMEADDERFLLREKDSLNTVAINKLQIELALQRQITRNHELADIKQEAEYNLLVEDLSDCDAYTTFLEEKIEKKNKLLRLTPLFLLLLLL